MRTGDPGGPSDLGTALCLGRSWPPDSPATDSVIPDGESQQEDVVQTIGGLVRGPKTPGWCGRAYWGSVDGRSGLCRTGPEPEARVWAAVLDPHCGGVGGCGLRTQIAGRARIWDLCRDYSRCWAEGPCRSLKVRNRSQHGQWAVRVGCTSLFSWLLGLGPVHCSQST